MSEESEVSLPFHRSYLNRPEQTVYIDGVPSADPYRFEINLLTTADSSGIALRISIQFDKNAVIFNSTSKDGIWGSEETAETFPFQREEAFSLTITTTENSYDVKVNERHLYSFNLRLKAAVRSIGIDQQSKTAFPSVRITQVAVDGSWTLSSSLNGTTVILTSRVAPKRNIAVGKNGVTVGTTTSKGTKARFTATHTSLAVCTLRNVKFPEKFLTIRYDTLKADNDSPYNKFRVRETNFGYYTFQSDISLTSFIGVDRSGQIIPPSRVRGIVSNFHGSSKDEEDSSSKDEEQPEETC
ncbi:uncharacterized protein LOC134178797 [Corticium candelabrum]|uniref:uncharacterized protein LOC134178797 n=1 Tax=Corticium candelabrum TaxID=121492 RepID=UPI002E262D8B|nr:uncharacterized protein LOC134178797 [Corticium candelabrum]